MLNKTESAISGFVSSDVFIELKCFCVLYVETRLNLFRDIVARMIRKYLLPSFHTIRTYKTIQSISALRTDKMMTADDLSLSTYCVNLTQGVEV